MAAIIPTTPRNIKINLIDTGSNPRRFFSPAGHESLVQSIKRHGVLQAITVREKAEDRFDLVFGERRLRAAREAFGQFDEISAYVRPADMTDDECLQLAIVENEERQEPSRTEQADAAAQLVERNNGDKDEVARILSWSRSKLDRHLALAKLTLTVKTALDEGRIKIGHAELLAAVPEAKQEVALKRILDAKLSVDKTSEMLMAVTHALAAAVFDRAQCAGCSFNSATQRALFETHITDGHCTNPPCYELKTSTHTAELAAIEAEKAPEPALATAGAQTPTTAPAGPAATGKSQVPTTPPARTPSPAPSSPPGDTLAQCRRTAKERRESAWRRACANAVVRDYIAARSIIITAAYDGSLNDIPRDALKLKAERILGSGYLSKSYADRLATVDTADTPTTDLALAAIAGAYIMEVKSFDVVAEIARRWKYDIRADWVVDKKFLELFTKPMLREIALEAGFVRHMGEKNFARLYGGKRDDLIKGMLGSPGFAWKGILPSSMTRDGTFGPAPTSPAPSAPTGADAAGVSDEAGETEGQVNAREPVLA